MIEKSDIKDIIKENTVQFDCFRQGHFYYMICVPGHIMARANPPTGPMHVFPVPLEDIGDATL